VVLEVTLALENRQETLVMPTRRTLENLLLRALEILQLKGG